MRRTHFIPHARLSVIPFPGTLVAWANSRSRAQLRCGAKPVHVYICLHQNDLRATLGNLGYLANLRNGRLKLRHVLFCHPVQLLKAFVQVIDVVEDSVSVTYFFPED